MPHQYTLTSNIPYLPSPHPAQHLDLYIPNTTTPLSPPHPLIIYIHGGAFKFGDKLNPLLPLRLVTHNAYALASINYRLSGDAPFPAAVNDCKAAVRFLRTHAAEYNLDVDRFIAMGESAGAYMAVMLGVTGVRQDIPEFISEDSTSSAVRGVVDFYGPTDFAQMDAHAIPGSPFKHDDPDSPESLFIGRHILDPSAKKLVQRANPITYVSRETPPVLIAHGTMDRIVPFHQSLLLEQVLKATGREVVFHPVEGVDHVFEGISEGQQGELDSVVDGWLRRVLVR